NYNYVFDQFFLCLIRFIHFAQIEQKCSGKGHISKDCSNPTTPKSCYNCEKRLFSIPQGQMFQMLIVLPQEEPTRPNNHIQEDEAKEDSTCGGVGHLSRDCVGDQKCFNCGEVGHVSRDCLHAQAKNCYSVSIIKIFYISFKDKNSPHFLICFCWISLVIQC
ncbi:hypothetical protein MJO28_017510, partial [Puccinia striiformis f. sp. tritici]